MNDKPVECTEFLVSECLATPEGLLVRGICNRGTITLGEVFDSVVRERDPATPAALQLRVSGIVAYRRAITELPHGMSAELHCTGSGAEELTENDLLVASGTGRA